jgi:hypothetical protein
VRKVKIISTGTSAPIPKERHSRYFWGILYISPQPTQKKSPEVSRHSAPAREISGSRTSQLHAKKLSDLFLKGASYSGLNSQHGAGHARPSRKASPKPIWRLSALLWVQFLH